MGVPVLALIRKNKIRESQYYCHSQNVNPSKFMPYTVHVCMIESAAGNVPMICELLEVKVRRSTS